jgi:hypothetical protein
VGEQKCQGVFHLWLSPEIVSVANDTVGEVNLSLWVESYDQVTRFGSENFMQVGLSLCALTDRGVDVRS